VASPHGAARVGRVGLGVDANAVADGELDVVAIGHVQGSRLHRLGRVERALRAE
jgi:hypothetical protein